MRAKKVHNKRKDRKITPRAREPGEMCRGEMKSSLGGVEFGILHLRLSGGWTRAGVDSSGAVVSCLGGDGGRTPPILARLHILRLGGQPRVLGPYTPIGSGRLPHPSDYRTSLIRYKGSYPVLLQRDYHV